MPAISIVLAGIAGTYAMTLFIHIVSRMTGYRFHVPAILGSMVSMKTKPSGEPSHERMSLLPGYILHYGIGVLFAAVYTEVFIPDSEPGYDRALLFGIVAGIVAVGFWFSVLKLHPLAPRVNLKLYLICIFIGHLVFSMAMNLSLRLLL